jgi:hypothetical protein
MPHENRGHLQGSRSGHWEIFPYARRGDGNVPVSLGSIEALRVNNSIELNFFFLRIKDERLLHRRLSLRLLLTGNSRQQ